MTTEVCIHLFGKPEWEINTEKASPNEIKNLGKDIAKRLEKAAKMMKILEKDGWDRSGGLYDISFFKDISKKEAKIQLKKIGIGLKEICLMEFEDEE